MAFEPFFSIVIPTRNRVDTLKHTLTTCINQCSFDDYEIVVNDNGDGSDTGDFIDSLIASDPRAREKLRYFRRSTVCSMSENFDDGIRNATGAFIIVIGDDDGMLPHALQEIHKLIEHHDVGIVKWKNGLYNWPRMSIPDAANYIGFSMTRSVSMKSCSEAMYDSLKNFNYENLPMMYINSAIKREMVDSIRGQDGRIFKSQSPDIFSALALAYHCTEFLEATVPFTLAGLSQYSNGVSFSFDGKNPAPKDDFNALNAQADIRQHPFVPDVNVFPHVAFAETFYRVKSHHFATDDAIQLSRRRLMEACVARADTEVEAVRGELLRVCEDDADLADFTRALIAAKTETLPPPRLKPAHLGFDGENLHLDPRDYGVATIADAVALVHRIVWPADAPLRYDISSAADIRADLEATLRDLQQTRGALVQRSGDLELVLEELRELRGTLVQRSADLEATLTDVQTIRELLSDRTARLEAALAECQDLRSRLAADR